MISYEVYRFIIHQRVVSAQLFNDNLAVFRNPAKRLGNDVSINLRYLERSIREAFGFGSTPIKIRVRKRNE